MRTFSLHCELRKSMNYAEQLNYCGDKKISICLSRALWFDVIITSLESYKVLITLNNIRCTAFPLHFIEKEC